MILEKEVQIFDEQSRMNRRSLFEKNISFDDQKYRAKSAAFSQPDSLLALKHQQQANKLPYSKITEAPAQEEQDKSFVGKTDGEEVKYEANYADSPSKTFVSHFDKEIDKMSK